MDTPREKRSGVFAPCTHSAVAFRELFWFQLKDVDPLLKKRSIEQQSGDDCSQVERKV